MEEPQIRSLIILIKLDAEGLYSRLKDNFREYMQIFAMKRTREHFKDVFKSRFYEIPISDLKSLGEDLILALDKFYKEVDSLKWYLNCTEDMPATVEDKVARTLRELKAHYDLCKLYLDAELGHVGVEDAQNQTKTESEFVGGSSSSTFQDQPFKFDLPES